MCYSPAFNDETASRRPTLFLDMSAAKTPASPEKASPKDARAEHARLGAEIAKHDIAYHQNDAPTVSDADYDRYRAERMLAEDYLMADGTPY